MGCHATVPGITRSTTRSALSVGAVISLTVAPSDISQTPNSAKEAPMTNDHVINIPADVSIRELTEDQLQKVPVGH
jgi:hypothetical protein